MPKLNQFLQIKEAAQYLGVSPSTLRNWGRTGKITERRHPVNQYRLYGQIELDLILNATRTPVRRTNKVR